MQNDKIYWL